MTHRERFLAVMEYQPVDRVPNWEAGVWGQTQDRWNDEGLGRHEEHWDWFTGSAVFDFDPREFIQVDYKMRPEFEEAVISEDERTVTFRDVKGITREALKEGGAHGTRASMDRYLSFPIETRADFQRLKERYQSSTAGRYPLYWREFNLAGWKTRHHPLILGRNTQTAGFYWRAREWMGTENLSYAWYDQPALMDEMMEFICDYTIAVSEPILQEVSVDYIMLAEDIAMKTGPLLGPQTYKRFIFPHLRRLVDYFKSRGVPYFLIDTDGNMEPLLPLFLDAGVDGLWPLERASDGTDPHFLRGKYGRQLRLWGAVDKREIARGGSAIKAHLKDLAPLIEEGGFIPTVDHTVPPDVSLQNFRLYLELKRQLLEGRL